LTGAHRWFDLPDVPTMVELGYKDFISDTFQGFLAACENARRHRRDARRQVDRGSQDPENRRSKLRIMVSRSSQRPDGMKKRIDDDGAEMAGDRRQGRHQACVRQAPVRGGLCAARATTILLAARGMPRVVPQ